MRRFHLFADANSYGDYCSSLFADADSKFCVNADSSLLEEFPKFNHALRDLYIYI